MLRMRFAPQLTLPLRTVWGRKVCSTKPHSRAVDSIGRGLAFWRRGGGKLGRPSLHRGEGSGSGCGLFRRPPCPRCRAVSSGCRVGTAHQTRCCPVGAAFPRPARDKPAAIESCGGRMVCSIKPHSRGIDSVGQGPRKGQNTCLFEGCWYTRKNAHECWPVSIRRRRCWDEEGTAGAIS